MGGAPRVEQDQFVLLDTLFTHTSETKAFSFFAVPKEVPGNWKAPLNFHNGTMHCRLEVLSKPSDRMVSWQFCVFQAGDGLGHA